MTLPSKPLLALLLSVDIGAGWFVGDWRRATPQPSADANPPPQAKSDARPRPTLPTSARLSSFASSVAPLQEALAMDDDALFAEFMRMQLPRQSDPTRLNALLMCTIAVELTHRSADPARTITALRDATPSGRPASPYIYSAAIEAWALRDPIAAAKFVDESKIKIYGNSPLQILATKDLDHALQLVAQIANKDKRVKEHAAILQDLARDDLQTALAGTIALSELSQSQTAYALEELFTTLPPDQLGSAIVQLRTAVMDGADVPVYVMSRALSQLARHDPIHAAELYLQSVPNHKLTPNSILGSWSRHSPRDALAWARAELPEDQRNEAIKTCLSGWCREDPIAAWQEINDPASPNYEALTRDEWLTKSSASNLGDRLDETIQAVLNNESDLPVEFIMSSSVFNGPLGEEIRNDLVGRLIADPTLVDHTGYRDEPKTGFFNSNFLKNWAADAPVQAEELFNSLPREQSERAIYSLATGMAQTTPARAAALVLDQPASPARDSALQVVVSQWAHRHPAAALDWIDALPPGPTKDLAVRNAQNQAALYHEGSR